MEKRTEESMERMEEKDGGDERREGERIVYQHLKHDSYFITHRNFFKILNMSSFNIHSTLIKHLAPLVTRKSQDTVLYISKFKIIVKSHNIQISISSFIFPEERSLLMSHF